MLVILLLYVSHLNNGKEKITDAEDLLRESIDKLFIDDKYTTVTGYPLQ
jgi:hypothetical protein